MGGPPGSLSATMYRVRSHLRLVGALAALAACLLLAVHFCVDVGNGHAPVAVHASHGHDDGHGAELTHPDCPVALSPDRDPGHALIVTDVGPAAVTLDLGQPARYVPVVCSADVARARSAPLFLLHASLLI